MDCGYSTKDSETPLRFNSDKAGTSQQEVAVESSPIIAESEKERIELLLEQYGWTVDQKLGVVDSMSKVMSYVRTGSIDNEMYYSNRFREVRAELRKAKPDSPRPLKEELCAIAFNCNILVALPLTDFNQVDTFLLEKPVGVLPAWLHMSELPHTLTVASFPAADRESSLYAILQNQASPSEEKTFRCPQLVRTFPGFRAVPSKRKALPKSPETLIISEKHAKIRSDRESNFRAPTQLPTLEVAIAS